MNFRDEVNGIARRDGTFVFQHWVALLDIAQLQYSVVQRKSYQKPAVGLDREEH